MTRPLPRGDTKWLSRRDMRLIAEEVGLAGSELYGLIQPADAWCRQAGVSLRWTDTPSHEGRYQLHRFSPTVTLSRHDHKPRLNFTLAHELGHHLLERSRQHPPLRARLSPTVRRHLGHLTPLSDDEEAVCDAIAAVLLLSLREVGVFSTAGPCVMSRVLALSASQGMSLSATIIRLQDLDVTAQTFVALRRTGTRWEVTRAVGILQVPERAYIDSGDEHNLEHSPTAWLNGARGRQRIHVDASCPSAYRAVALIRESD